MPSPVPVAPPSDVPRRRRRRGSTLLAAVSVGTLLAACAGSAPESSRTDVGGVSGDVVVFAASSLADAFAAIGEAFSEANPGLSVTFEFGGSSTLASQLANGAPADVFVAADERSMATVVDAGRAQDSPVVVATNTLQIVAGAGNPRAITSLADLADPASTVVLCAVEVPCGRYSQQVLAAAGVSVTPRSWEQSVKAVLSKVSLGEADAGIVYRTDVIAAGDAVVGIDIDPSVAVTAAYPAVVTSASDAAAAFVAFLVSADAQRILSEFGFGAP